MSLSTMSRPLVGVLLSAMATSVGLGAIVARELAPYLTLVASPGMFGTREFALDMDANGTREFLFTWPSGNGGIRTDPGSEILATKTQPIDFATLPFRVSEGELIRPESPADFTGFYPGASDWWSLQETQGPGVFFVHGWGPSGNVDTGFFSYVRGYVGVRFLIEDELHYGWIDIENPWGLNSMRIHGWAYETEPNTPIVAGSVPEPSLSVLLAAGGVLLFGRKRAPRGAAL